MDKYYIYRPLLNLLGKSEGTDRRDGYNETLGYGKMLDGIVSGKSQPRIILTNKTLGQIDDIQTRMLKDPDNKRLNSSAIGRYQIVRTTMRSIKKALRLSDDALFNEDMQDRMACFLLGQRGIDKWLGGHMSQDTLINNLAHEWASLPTVAGYSAYAKVKPGDIHAAQRSSVKVTEVREVLSVVNERWKEGQPHEVIVPETVEKEVKKKFDLLQWVGATLGSLGVGASALAGFEWKSLLVLCSFALGGLGLTLFYRAKIIEAIKDLREELS